MSQQQNNDMQQHFYRASAADFGKIPGSPVAYWASKKIIESFNDLNIFQSIGNPRLPMTTGDNARFMRMWYEVGNHCIGFDCKSRVESKNSKKRWFPCNKGGAFRRWYGNNIYVVNWFSDGEEILELNTRLYGSPSRNVRSMDCYFLESITWSSISSSTFSARYSPIGSLFATGGSCAFPDKKYILPLLAMLLSKVTLHILSFLSPTLNFEVGTVGSLPLVESLNNSIVVDICTKAIEIVKNDWNSYETSWDFTSLPLLEKNSNNYQATISASYQYTRSNWFATPLEMQRLEEENNRLFIEAYGLQDELAPEVPLSEITLTCNPHYRYGGNLTDAEREARLQSDTIAELISYAIGCMMGRYSLDREGLVYAHAGNEGFKQLQDAGAYARFAADDDGILPLTQENWFSDDIAARLERFVATVWGAAQLEENLQFIADSLCLYAVKPAKKGGETARETIRRYLSSQFYKDHLKTYKKRPIYWLFSSGKEKAFEALVYLHRYSESTLPRLRTEYVTPLLGQLASQIEHKRLEQTEASTARAKQIDKEIN
ncbi:BREX-1 system adenine-specific DNA-methyltransferase PglX, partial [Shewanella sp.]|uniref:BREX-1 system adenine-specific DNA-methyltransferase PglX n=1 Tax=Shewanella sp. TaxID=50422 RepID=UPI003F34FF0D